MGDDNNVSSLLIDLTRLTATFYIKQLHWCQYKHLTPLTREECEKWGALATDDYLNTLMHWAADSTQAKDYLVDRLPWFQGEQIDEFRAAVLDDIYYVFVKQPIVNYIGYTWFVWSVTECAGDLLLNKGMDYRVMEWYRLTGTEMPEEE